MKLNDNTLFKTECLIDGTWRRADNGRTLSVRNPATGEHLADVPDMGESETRAAIAPQPPRKKTGRRVLPPNAAVSCAAGST